ncbi:MAG TPA: OsmC family protein [Kofleriaceae bacterium]|nr:OsmC family protein [Kofleriaceae bacterium]
MTRPAPFPHRYSVQLAGAQLLAPPRQAIAAGPPPQFGGTDQVWSPEELLVAATLECLWTTFEAFARRDALTVHEWSGSGVATLDRSPSGPAFTSIVLTVDVSVSAGDEALARRVLASAEKHCIISNALRVPVVLEVNVHGDAPSAAAS